MGKTFKITTLGHVLAAAFLLAGCAQRKATPALFSEGYTHCDSTNGEEYDVILSKSTTQTGYFDITINNIIVNSPGEQSRISIVNQGAHLDLKDPVIITEGQTVYKGTLSPDNLSTYPTLAITAFNPQITDPLTSTSPRDAVCTLPTTDISQGDPSSTSGGSAI